MPALNQKDLERWFLEGYDANADIVFRFCLFKLRDREAATDIAHETFTRMWEYVSLGKPIEHFRAFAFRVARNAITDYAKKARPVYEHELGDTAAEVLESSTFGDSEAYAELGGVLECLKGLPENEQEMVLLRFTEGVPVKDIAEELAELPNTVTQKLKRAVQALRECLGIMPSSKTS
ncbi:MAG: sigma-70 family RNA polymerase sigma factor [Patescibacteria group bacterium]